MKNLIWNYGTEGAKLSGAVAAVGTTLTAILGGWDKPLQLLAVLMLFDFILGVLQAAKAGQLNSKTMFWGGINKILVLILVVVACFIDDALPMQEPYVRTAVIFYYCGREGLSLVENYGKLGLPLPAFIIGILEQLQDKGDKGGGE